MLPGFPTFRANAERAVLAAPFPANRAFAVELMLPLKHAATLAKALHQMKSAGRTAARAFARRRVLAAKLIDFVGDRSCDGCHDRCSSGGACRYGLNPSALD